MELLSKGTVRKKEKKNTSTSEKNSKNIAKDYTHIHFADDFPNDSL